MRATQPDQDELPGAAPVDIRPEAALTAAQHILGMVAGDLARAGFYASAHAVSALADLIAREPRRH